MIIRRNAPGRGPIWQIRPWGVRPPRPTPAVTRSRLLSFVLTLAMVVGLVPAVPTPAYAAATWSGEVPISSTDTIDVGVTLNADITLTIAEGATLTVNGGINAGSYTLTVEGTGVCHADSRRCRRTRP